MYLTIIVVIVRQERWTLILILCQVGNLNDCHVQVIVDGCSVEAMLQRMVLVAMREKSGRF